MWRTGANTDTKLLMLRHAFERLGCMRVEFKTDARNERSRAALAALPAQFEGIFRRHMLTPNVGVRDSAYYSVTDEEWPKLRTNSSTGSPPCEHAPGDRSPPPLGGVPEWSAGQPTPSSAGSSFNERRISAPAWPFRKGTVRARGPVPRRGQRLSSAAGRSRCPRDAAEGASAGSSGPAHPSSPRMSCAVRLLANRSPSSMTPLNSAALRRARATTFSSIVLRAIIL
jgi:hypothetical protein